MKLNVPRQVNDLPWKLILTGILTYAGLGQITHFIPNPMVTEASLALNMVVPVIIGYFGGSVAGGVVGLLGTTLNYFAKIPFHGPDAYELAAILPHMAMGAVAGLRSLGHSRIGTALTVVIGHGLNIAGFLLLGLLPFTVLKGIPFWTGLLTETVVDVIIIALFIGLQYCCRTEGGGFAKQRLGAHRFWLLSGLNAALVLFLSLSYLKGVALASYLFVMPVIFAGMTLGFLEAWLTAILLSFVLGSALLQGGVAGAAQEVSQVLMLNIVALAVGELADNIQQQQQLGHIQMLKLEKAYATLTKADRLKADMIRNISHELRTPLALVLGYVEMLRDKTWGALPPDQQSVVALVQEHAQRLVQIVERITVLHEVEYGHLTWHSIPLETMVRQLVKDYQDKATTKEYTFNLNVKGPILPLYGDTQYLGQAIETLLDNAIKFSPDGGDVDVRLWSKDQRVFFSVQDHGVGIPLEQQERLFQRFSQGDGSTTRRFGGLGIGLALAKEVIQAHGGDVWVESKLGKGSIFGFWLPSQQKEQ